MKIFEKFPLYSPHVHIISHWSTIPIHYSPSSPYFFLIFLTSFQNSFRILFMSLLILLPNVSFPSNFLVRIQLLAFFFYSLYISIHLSFEHSSSTFCTSNHTSFSILTVYITSSSHHTLLFLVLTLAHQHTSLAILTYASFIWLRICSTSCCLHSDDLFASALTYFSL